jgi:predicted nuclease of predicted toxin-antitoxin system
VRWLADECVSPFLVGRLRDDGHDGHDVLYMAEIAPGVPDSDIVKRADQDHRLLLTEDKDFGELLFRWHQAAPGIVLLRIFAGSRPLI